MTIKPLPLEGALLITPRVFTDNRGYFFETYNEHAFRKAGLEFNFVQDNQSMSAKNVLRGLHFQLPPYEQGKLVRVSSGAVLDVIVDIRPASPTFGQHCSEILDAKTHQMMWIPPGFAHGFLALEENTVFVYKCTGFYNKEYERGILWNDPRLGINWGIDQPVISDKDQELMPFEEFKSLFC